MKISMMALLILGFQLSAHADPQACGGNLEAQFIAQYTHVDYSYDEAGNAGHTTFGLKNFSDFQENGNCPLDIDVVSQAAITVPGVQNSIYEGAQVSGILIYNQETNTFTIE